MIKIVVTGSESTGKTGLARKLGAHFSAPVSEEFVRGYAAARRDALAFADHGPIAHGQMAAEDAAVRRAANLVILDTDLISTVIYCEHYFGRCPAWIEDAARSRLARRYLLLKPDVPWIPDGVRDRGDRRDEMHALFASTLRRFGASVAEIGGSWDERFASAVAAVEEILD
jgi:NadR type nicotinamide-nucleotide adenylyltransferase